MTNTEFNYKYREYLVPDSDGLNFNDPKVIEYLDSKFTEFIFIYGFKWNEVKIKINWVCFYSNLDDEIRYEVEQEIKNILKL